MHQHNQHKQSQREKAYEDNPFAPNRQPYPQTQNSTE